MANTTARKGGLTDGQLVLMNKGMYAKIKPMGDSPWRGTDRIGKLYDPVQSELNHKLGYW